MPLDLITDEKGSHLVLDGIVTAEDTDQFVAYLKEYPELSLDLSACEHLHTAVLQAILILKPHISALPVDPFWKLCLANQDKENIYEENTAG